MTDAINGYSRNMPGSRQSPSASANKTGSSESSATAKSASPTVASPAGAVARGSAPSVDDSLDLSQTALNVMYDPGFDRSKVDAIKQALKEGKYPLDARRIAESFVALERMIDK